MFGLTPADRALLARVERKLDLIIDSLGLEESAPADLEQVRLLAQQGRKIEAIRLYRETTGVGLKEAKDAVDQM